MGAEMCAITKTWGRLGWACGDFPWVYGYRHLFWRFWWRAV